ncbi:MAG: UDP-N-acetylmuramoyl-L-alanine--D-glutamate ligase, partial [Pseudomonadota bacterium]
MIPASTFAGQTVAVFGLGGSGLAACRSLRAGGAAVAAWDDGRAACERAAGDGITVVDLGKSDWSTFSALVLAPGVPLTHPEPHWTVKRAHAARVPVIGDTEVLFREWTASQAKPQIIAITGTNGKSTTTALTGHVLSFAGLRVAIGGNIGTPALSLPSFEDI